MTDQTHSSKMSTDFSTAVATRPVVDDDGFINLSAAKHNKRVALQARKEARRLKAEEEAARNNVVSEEDFIAQAMAMSNPGDDGLVDLSEGQDLEEKVVLKGDFPSDSVQDVTSAGYSHGYATSADEEPPKAKKEKKAKLVPPPKKVVVAPVNRFSALELNSDEDDG
jgi:hypothetical protein